MTGPVLVTYDFFQLFSLQLLGPHRKIMFPHCLLSETERSGVSQAVKAKKAPKRRQRFTRLQIVNPNHANCACADCAEELNGRLRGETRFRTKSKYGLDVDVVVFDRVFTGREEIHSELWSKGKRLV